MFIDLRYHIVSIVAVFLALGVGILIGGSITRTASLEKRTDRAIQEVKSQLTRLDQETARSLRLLQSDLATYEAFGSAVLKTFAGVRFRNRSLTLLQTGDYPEAASALKAALLANGARVTATVALTDRFPPADESEALRFAESLGLEAASPEEIGTRAARLLAHAMAAGSSEVLQKLRRAGVIALSGDPSQPARTLVLIGGGNLMDDRTAVEFDAPLLAALKEHSLLVIGTEPENALTSYIPTYQEAGVPTIDNIDRAPGQVCLAYILSGEEGHFGVKPTARQLLPRQFDE
ncbi:MAG: copper transporter [Armatimonadetes bacterium]|nr:copper transporter [Armatimonadota bacterium]